MGDVTIVMATCDRGDLALSTVARLVELPERAPVIVVDNGSSDGTGRRVAEAFPQVRVICLDQNQGAAARTVGVEAATTPYVAFADDDSWWEPGALDRAARCFAAAPRLAVVAATIVLEPSGEVDPIADVMAHGPLPAVPDVPGIPILGFVACGAVVRRSAYLEVGGFDPLLFFLGEEDALAIDLAVAGWQLAYVADVVAHHHPAAATRDVPARRRLQTRNRLLTAWTRRSLRHAVGATAGVLRAAGADPASRAALVDALGRLPAALRQRRPPPREVEQRLRLLDGTGPTTPGPKE